MTEYVPELEHNRSIVGLNLFAACKKSALYLSELADSLEKAPRAGTIHDESEGTRYLTMSDTLARHITQSLREIVQNLQDLI